MSDYTVKIAENETHVLKIIQDSDADSPRVDYGNAGTMYCWHKRYNLGDKHDYSEPRDFLEDVVGELTDMDYRYIQEMSSEELINVLKDNAIVLPLFLYDHSGITMNTTGFSCQWDSGQIGYTYMTHETVVKEFGSLDIEKAEGLLKAEVETYDQYLRGEIYGFVLQEKTKCECCKSIDIETVDSCWGFYGLDHLESELKSYIGEEYSELIEKLDWAV